jgi:lipopolysaccharide biosynthesis glycosyltransferase
VIVACLTDRRFAQFAGVLLSSLFDNGDIADDWRLIVFGLGLRPGDKARIRASCGPFADRPEFVDIDVNNPVFSKLLPTRWSLTPANYARLLLPEIMAGEDDRLLYLDCDMLVLASLRPLATIDMEGCTIAVVCEPDASNHPAADGRLPHPAEIPYFNAGLLLIDLDAWRREDLTRRTFAFIQAHQSQLRFAEQDALNCVTAGRWKALDPAWNYTHARVAAAGGYEAARIVHFTGAKPTTKDCRHPAQPLFLRYRARTPWRHKRLATRFERRMSKLFQKRVRRLISAIRLGRRALRR